ncbi:MAG: hypothetical protein AB9856_20315 [Cellulosilyticaceae bacterium]
MKKIFLISVLVAMLLVVGGCTKGSSFILSGDETNTPTQMAMTYKRFSGFKQTDIKVKKGEPLTVKVGIVTQKGHLDAYIAKDNDLQNCQYQGTNLSTSSFEVTLTEEGTYTIRVDANKHTGSYSFSWEK